MPPYNHVHYCAAPWLGLVPNAAAIYCCSHILLQAATPQDRAPGSTLSIMFGAVLKCSGSSCCTLPIS